MTPTHPVGPMVAVPSSKAGTLPTSITSSMLEDWIACRRKFWYKYIYRIEPDAPQIHTGAGAAFAKGIATAREGKLLLHT